MTADIQLDTLEAKGLIKLASVHPELEYLFRHWLIQDAAYGSLLKQERRLLHARVGEALEELYPDRQAELAAVLAIHFEQAGETGKAIRYLVAAAEYGHVRNALREAFDAFDRAATLLAESGAADEEARRLRVRIVTGRAETAFSFRSPDEILADLDSIVPEAEALGDVGLLRRIHTLIALVRLTVGGKPDDPIVRRSLDRMEEIGRQIGDPSLRALPLALVGMAQVFAGSTREGVAALEESVPLLDDDTNSIGAAFARGALAIGYSTLGEFEKAEEAARRATEIAAKGDLIAQLDALIAASMVRSMRGDLEAALPMAQECVDRATETGATACAMASSWVLGDAFHRLGRFEEARESLKRGAEISNLVDRKVWRPTLQAWLGSTMAVLGEADGDWDEALATARSIGNRGGEGGILAKRAEAAAARGVWDAAAADFEAAATIIEAEGARPSLARTLVGWGEALRGAGRTAEAEPLLRRALGLFEEVGLEREAAAVRATLAVGATAIAFD